MRILGLASLFRRMSWKVCLIVPDHFFQADLCCKADGLYTARGSSYVGGRFSSFDPAPFAVEMDKAKRELKPRVVIAEYAWMSPILDHVPAGVGRGVDSHDLLHERTRRFSDLGLDPQVRCTREEELDLLRHADVVVATQSREEETLKRLLPDKRVLCLLPAVELSARCRRYSVKSPLLLTGESRNPPVPRFLLASRASSACGERNFPAGAQTQRRPGRRRPRSLLLLPFGFHRCLPNHSRNRREDRNA
jgi:succinoglycan biosynthesis protein ExoO